MITDLYCDLNATPTALHHPWRMCVGSGHATLALRADWQAQLTTASGELGFRYVRFHGLLDDDMGTLICQSNEFVYSFFNADQIFDFLLSIGMRPIVELSFMPSTLSSGDDIVFHYKGNVTPPRHLEQWAELMRRLAAHWVERYGIEEVAQWYFEVWNEPNLRAFWTGEQRQYFDMYAATHQAIKGVDARLRVGGPATAGNAWIAEFQQYCAGQAVPPDFISTHYYPTDAFGEIGADTITQLEHASLDVMRQHALIAREQAAGKPLLYTEWNITSNPRDPLHDGAAAAALATRIILGVDDVVQAYSYWTFTDIFEENYFPSQPFHGGFGLMNLHGIKKPIYHAFAMVAKLGDAHHPVAQAHPSMALWMGAHDAGQACSHAVAINQAMPRHAIDAVPLRLTLGVPTGRRAARVSIARIDADHANPVAVWRSWGAPDYLSPAQVAQLQAAATPVPEPLAFTEVAGALVIEASLAPQSANLIRIDWTAA